MDALFRLVLTNALWATALAVIAVVGARVWRRRPAVAHLLWLLVLLKPVTPSLVQVASPWDGARARALPIVAVSNVPLGPTTVLKTDAASLQVSLPSFRRTSDEPSPPPDQPAVKRLSVELDASAPRAWAWRPAVVLLWSLGAVTWWLLVGRSSARFLRLTRSARPAPAELADRVGRIAARLGVHRIPAVGLIPARVPPMLWASIAGPARLILPEVLWARLDDTQQDAVLAHELAHLKRRDHWVRRLEAVVLGLYWWDPVAWWARRQLERAEEECCDAWVVWALPSAASAYAEALVATTAFLSGYHRTMPFVASGAGRSLPLKRRLNMIMNHPAAGSLTRSIPWTVLMLGMMGLPFLPALAAKQSARPETREVSQQIERREEPFAILRIEPLQEEVAESKSVAPYLQTQVKLMTNDRVLEPAVASSSVAKLPAITKSQDPKADLRKKLEVEILEDSYLIRVSLELPNAEHAAMIVNAVVDSYMSYHKEYKHGANAQLKSSLKLQLEKLENELKTKIGELQASHQKGTVEIGKPKLYIGPPESFENSAQPTFSSLTEDRVQRIVDQMVTTDLELIAVQAALETARQAANRAPGEEKAQQPQQDAERLETRIAEEFHKDPEVVALIQEIKAARELCDRYRAPLRWNNDPARRAAEKQYKKLTEQYEELWNDKFPEIKQRLKGVTGSSQSPETIHELTMRVEELARKKADTDALFELLKIEKKDSTDAFQATLLNYELQSMQNKREQVTANLAQLDFELEQDNFRVVLVHRASAPKTATNSAPLKTAPSSFKSEPKSAEPVTRTDPPAKALPPAPDVRVHQFHRRQELLREFVASKDPPEKAANAPPKVHVAQAIEREVQDFVIVGARLDAAATVELRAQVSGRIDKVRCRPGQKVEKGDILFEIDPDRYQAEVRKAQAEVQLAEARVRRLAARKARTEELVKSKNVEQKVLDQMEGDLAEAEASLRAAQAALETPTLNLNATKVRAPIAGTLTGDSVPDEGNVVAANTTRLGTILALDKVYVSFSIPTATALQIRRLNRDNKQLGNVDTAETILVELTGKGDFPHRANLDFVDVRVRAGEVLCRAVLPNPDPLLCYPGMSARVKLFTSRPYRAFVLPERTVMDVEEGEVGWQIYVVNDGDFVENRRVIAERAGGFWKVVSGLKRDEWVVIDKAFKRNLVSEHVKVDPVRVPTPVPSTPAAAKAAPE